MPREKRPHSLRLILLTLLCALLASFAAIFFSILHASMPAMLVQSESKYLTKQIEVVSGVFASEKERTLSLADDMAVWGDTVEFVKGNNPDYITTNWPDNSILQVYRCNFVVIKNISGDDVYVEFYDYVKHKPLPVPEGFSDALRGIAEEVLWQHSLPKYAEQPESWGKGGIMFYKGAPYTVAAMPVMTSHDTGAPVGTVILGNILDSDYFRRVTHYDTSVFSLVQGGGDESSILRENDNVVSTTLPLRDVDGNPMTLRMSDARTIYTEGMATLNRTMLTLAGCTILFALILYQIVRRRILLPIERLSKDLESAGSDGGIDADKYSGSREFAALCSSINEMRHGLSQSKISLDVLQSILNGMDAYLYVTDPETDKILFINDKMREHYGIPEEGVGKICWQVLQSGMTERCDFCPNHTLENNPEKTVVWEEHSSLTGHYYRNTDGLIDWPGGKKAHLQHSVDITANKIAEAALQKRLEQQELMADMARGFISPDDMETLIASALRMAGRFMNVSSILLGKLDSGMLDFKYAWSNEEHGSTSIDGKGYPFGAGHPAYQAFVIEKAPYIAHADTSGVQGYARIANAGVKALIAVPVHVSGALWGVLSVEDSTAPREWTPSDKQLLTLIGSIISGVIMRSETEEKLVRMSSIVNSSPQYISYINAQGNFEYFNQGALNMLGYAAEELQDSNISRILDPESYRRSIQEIIPAIQKNGRADFEMPVRRKDGQERILRFSAFQTNYKDVGIGSIASDITETRQLENALLAAKEHAEQSSRAKGEFLSRMSHEMRTPLNAIIGMTSIARSAADLEKKEYCLDKIDSASKHLLGVINDILDMSKIEANKFELSPTDFVFEKMLMRVVNVVNFRVEEKRQTLIIHVDNDVPASIVADEQRLAQIIANLLSNAVKFTPERGSITLSAYRTDEKDGLCTLRIDVKDTGIGISSEQQSKLFHSFEQADGGIARKFGGTGLGLAISKSIVELMGGEIWVESSEGGGATFSFTLKARTGSSGHGPLLPPDVNWSNLRVLAVDDAPEVREYFLNLSQSIGFSCTVAADGFEACDLLDADAPFNMVFVDWKMPGMDGIELTRKIKAKAGAKAVVIMISSSEWDEIGAEAQKAGVDGFLPKPLFSSLVVDCITNCLGSGRCVAPEGPTPREPSQSDDLTGYRALLAEDNDINKEIVFALLEYTNIAIDWAGNGEQAFQMFQANQSLYDIIFMDIHMPEVDGYEATRRIRALDGQKAREIPIVAMTANVFREDVEQCLAAGMTDHIGKPISVEEIVTKLKKYLAPR